jgi:hypothetical protein
MAATALPVHTPTNAESNSHLIERLNADAWGAETRTGEARDSAACV